MCIFHGLEQLNNILTRISQSLKIIKQYREKLDAYPHPFLCTIESYFLKDTEIRVTYIDHIKTIFYGS